MLSQQCSILIESCLVATVRAVGFHPHVNSVIKCFNVNVQIALDNGNDNSAICLLLLGIAIARKYTEYIHVTNIRLDIESKLLILFKFSCTVRQAACLVSTCIVLTYHGPLS